MLRILTRCFAASPQSLQPTTESGQCPSDPCVERVPGNAAAVAPQPLNPDNESDARSIRPAVDGDEEDAAGNGRGGAAASMFLTTELDGPPQQALAIVTTNSSSVGAFFPGERNSTPAAASRSTDSQLMTSRSPPLAATAGLSSGDEAARIRDLSFSRGSLSDSGGITHSANSQAASAAPPVSLASRISLFSILRTRTSTADDDVGGNSDDHGSGGSAAAALAPQQPRLQRMRSAGSPQSRPQWASQRGEADRDAVQQAAIRQRAERQQRLGRLLYEGVEHDRSTDENAQTADLEADLAADMMTELSAGLPAIPSERNRSGSPESTEVE